MNSIVCEPKAQCYLILAGSEDEKIESSATPQRGIIIIA